MNKEKIKILKCPICGFRLIDSDASCESVLVVADIPDIEIRPQYYQKCQHCKKIIGIKMVS